MKIAIHGQEPWSFKERPIAVILMQADRARIATMPPDAVVYAQFSEDAPVDDMTAWVEFLKRYSEE